MNTCCKVGWVWEHTYIFERITKMLQFISEGQNLKIHDFKSIWSTAAGCSRSCGFNRSFQHEFFPRKSMTWAGRPKVSWHWTTICIYRERESDLKRLFWDFAWDLADWMHHPRLHMHVNKHTSEQHAGQTRRVEWIIYFVLDGRITSRSFLRVGRRRGEE